MQSMTLIKYVFLFGIVVCFTSSLLFGFGIISLSADCNCDMKNIELGHRVAPISTEFDHHNSASVTHGPAVLLTPPPQHNLAILVPFRERFEELLQFVPHISEFLNKQSIHHHIFILNQIDRLRFNRASLINVGFLYTKKKNYDYIAMHDVDLLPLNDNLKYLYPNDGPLHIAAPEYHPKYHYATFVGGVLLVKREHYELLNGMSNKYWGWGMEDDEFYVRIQNAGLIVKRPNNITTGPQNTFKHIHDGSHRRRDTVKCYNQREITRRRDRETGLNTTKYFIEDVKKLILDNITLTILNIRLECDTLLTPWCDCTNKTK